MVMANTERIAKALDLLRDGLRPKCEETWRGFYGDDWLQTVNQRLHNPLRQPSTDDAAFLLTGIKLTWNEVFGHGFPAGVRSMVFEVADARNRWAHQQSVSTDDTIRALDSMERVLESFGNATERHQIRGLRQDLMRQMVDEQSRSERRRTAAQPAEGRPDKGLTPWREIITPHGDVASGRFEQAEFAANLYDVLEGTAETEYQDPRAFYARTYLTQGLEEMLVGAARRLSGEGGDPVIELQTNFGGGKTHSMIALYHLASGEPAAEMPGIGDVLAARGVSLPQQINRSVLVGQMIQPATPEDPEPDVRLNTLWGRLAYQLGGREAYELVRADDEAATNPGAALVKLFGQFGPAVVLIDEWVAYARQLPDGSNPNAVRPAGGDFDTQFTFAQALTEAAATVPNVVVLIAIPASDIETGGPQGRTALERLKNVVARKAAQWQPASPDESFEIVRRRLFDPVSAGQARVRDGVIRAFSEMYRKHAKEFPPRVGEGEYRRRMELSYPIHPELFDRLFGDWSALEKFQRTRGVLRLMALVISQLWQRDDRSLMIMPASLPMDSGPLVSEMKKYLDEGWDPVIKSDVDGENALPLHIDREYPHFGRIAATRRAARAVYMSSAPRPDGKRGVDVKSVVLGCAQPGESLGQFSDALRRLSDRATHLYVDGSQYWYSLVPNVTRIAEDRASNYDERDAEDLARRMVREQGDRGDFCAVQVFAEGPGDVPDNDDGVRLVVLAPKFTHSVGDDRSKAIEMAEKILNKRDAGPRLNRNLLVFVAPGTNRVGELLDAARSHLAWRSIVDSSDELQLTTHQLRQAQTKVDDSRKQIVSLIAETFNLVLTPEQLPGTSEIIWQTSRAAGEDTIAVRASRKLRSEENLISKYSGVRVRMDIDRGELWSDRGDLAVGELWSTYARFCHMPRLGSFEVMADALSGGVAALDWEQTTFAYADAHDGERWLGVRTAQHVTPTPSGLLIRPDSLPPPPDPDPDPGALADKSAGGRTDTESGASKSGASTGAAAGATAAPTEFYAEFQLDPVRCIKQLGEIAEHVTARLGPDVEITLEVRARNDSGFDDATRRTVSENATNLGSRSSEFE